MLLATRSTAPGCAAACGRRASPAPTLPKQRQGQQCVASSGSSGAANQLLQRQSIAVQRLSPPLAAADGSAADVPAAGAADAADAANKLPLWRFLQQQGLSKEGITRMRNSSTRTNKRVTGAQFSEEKLQRDLVPSIAALRAEGLDTATIEQLYGAAPTLLATTHSTFSSALAALRQLAALLPDDPRAVQAPPGATPLGVALWLYPTAASRLLARANLGSLIDSNLRVRQQLGVGGAFVAAALLQHSFALVPSMERGEAMVAHLQRLRANGVLSQEQVDVLARSQALRLTPTEFDRRWREGGLSKAGRQVAHLIGLSHPAGRQQAAAEVLGELLQAADGVSGPLQQQFRQQASAMVERNSHLWMAGAPSLRASWASLQQLGLSSSQVAAVVLKQPGVLTCDWGGGAKQRLLAWVQQELGLSPCAFLVRHSGYSTSSVGTLAMRADYLRQHRHAAWAEHRSRGAGPLLSLLTQTERFVRYADCTRPELAAYHRVWLATPAGRRWGVQPRRVRRPAHR